MIKYIGSPNFFEGREDKQVNKIICHWIVGKLSVADKVFQDTNRNTSAHFGVGGKEIHQYVGTENTAYHAGNWNVNLESIGIEHEGGPELPISEDTYKTSAKLIAALSLLYNIPLDREHIKEHREIVATACPGTLMVYKLIQLAQEYLAIQFTDQTIIPKELLGEDQDLEIQQIRGLLLDGKRDNLDLQNCRVENEKLKTEMMGQLAQNKDLARQLNLLRGDYDNLADNYEKCNKELSKCQQSLPNPPILADLTFIEWLLYPFQKWLK